MNQRSICPPDPLVAGMQRLQQQQAAEVAVAQMRIDIAAQVMAQLMGVQFLGHLNQPDPQPIDILSTAQLAVDSANALMVKLGILELVKEGK